MPGLASFWREGEHDVRELASAKDWLTAAGSGGPKTTDTGEVLG
ncbi:hypothetical protein DFJ66_6606 [Saccharothrix variisporea]|uniref:Uncharacterized protein n=1 Tax=Saccharothrix variisporea TaxID=543527 RepID=A0A495XGV6_9PSEU|nr:hypothetical protein DFJ66_6606 [Saccharothrix variisporea]